MLFEVHFVDEETGINLDEKLPVFDVRTIKKKDGDMEYEQVQFLTFISGMWEYDDADMYVPVGYTKYMK